MTLTLIIGFALIALEIRYDISRHKKGFNDKPQSTIIWIITVMILSAILPGMYYSNALLFLGQRFMFFDFGYNLARWKSLEIDDWSVTMGAYFYRSFIEKLFYHGENKKKWSYDSIMNRIPWYLELFLKLWVFVTVILDYYYDGSIIDWIFT